MVFQSPHPDVSILDVSLPSFVLEQAGRLGDKAALIEGETGRTLSYDELGRRVGLLAAGFVARGLRKGEVVAICLPNVPEYAVTFHGVASAGGVVTTINPVSTAGEVAAQLNDSHARYLVTISAFLERMLQAAAASPVEEIFVLGEPAREATPFAELLDQVDGIAGVEIHPREDLVALPYSSGTTGLPKGVMLTHRNLVANCCQIEVPHHVSDGDVLLGVLPFFHIFGMQVIMNLGLRAGATIVTMARFDLQELLRILQDHRVTRAELVPPIMVALAKHPLVDRYDLSSLWVIMSGAAPLSSDVAGAVGARLGCAVKQGYGMTELSPATHVIPDGAGKNKPGSVGPPLPNTECKLVDPRSGEEVGPGENGEVCIRGPQVMKGYLNNPEATAGVIDADGWLHTGDIGYADEDGYLSIVDRVKELIKYKGYQVAPAELEAMLLTHPSVADAAVIPHPDEEAGEVPKAYVVLNGTASPDEILTFVAERVAPYKKIRTLEAIDAIPKSPSGKILRRVLIEQDRAAAPAASRGS